jgi:hypothetical protein
MFAASKSGRAVASGATTDQYFPNTVLLLNDTGTNGAQNNTFIDSSTNNFTITRNGNATQGSVNPFEPTGYWSGNFSGSSQYLTVSTNSAFTYGLSDFTIECWVFLTTTGVLQYIIDQRNSGTANAVIPAIYVSASNVLTYFVSNAAQITGTTALVIGTWYHVAVSRGTLSTKMFLNGTQEGSTYVDANNYAASRVVISSNAATAGNYLTGFISNVRLVNGTAVYTSAFTPPTTPLTAITNTSLLCLQNNIYKDNSSNNFTITATGTPPITGFNQFIPTASYSGNTYGGSIYFDGTGDYFLFPTNSVFAFPADFTIEYWINLASGTPTVIDLRGGFGIVGFADFFTTGLVANIFKESTGTILTASAGMNYNVWNHVAYVRSGTTLSIYINGVNRGSVTDSTSWAAPSTTGRISGNYTNANLINGYISNLRIVKGTAVYTSAFTPPTAPLTAITNTSLLLNATNAGIYDATALNDMETVGNAQVSTTQYKWGASSMSFDGTGDWLLFPNNVNITLNQAVFTIEGWIYLNAVGSARGIVGKGTGTTGWLLSINSSNRVVFTDTTTAITSTGTLSVSTWYHIAVVRSTTGTNQTKIYINGTNDGTGTSATNFSQTNSMYVGANRTGGSAFNGYIEDLRITKGVARYTANFTAPTAAFPTR